MTLSSLPNDHDRDESKFDFGKGDPIDDEWRNEDVFSENSQDHGQQSQSHESHNTGTIVYSATGIEHRWESGDRGTSAPGIAHDGDSDDDEDIRAADVIEQTEQALVRHESANCEPIFLFCFNWASRQKAMEEFRSRVPAPKDLPPVSLLMNLVDSTYPNISAQPSCKAWDYSEENPFSIWSIAAQAVIHPVHSRVGAHFDAFLAHSNIFH